VPVDHPAHRAHFPCPPGEDCGGRTQSAVTRELLGLAWPIIGINVLQVLSLAVDTAMVGRTPDGAIALTGMGYASQVVFLLMVAMIGLTVGTVAFVSRAHGAGKDEQVDHILQQSTQLTLLLGLGVALVGNLVAGPILGLLGADAAAMEAGLAYLRPLLTFTVFSYLNLMYAAVLRGLGNTRLAFAVSMLMNGLNVVFNYGLILGNYGLPALGVQGAAIGTVLAQGIAAAIMFGLLNRGVMPRVKTTFRLAPIDRKLAGDLVRIGWPAATDMVVLNAGFLAIIGMLGRIDQYAVAAHGVGLRIQALAFVPGMSISQATGAMVGTALGKEHIEEARQVLRSSVVLCTLAMTAMGAVIVVWSDPIIALFDIGPGALFDFAVIWLRVLAASMPVVGIYIAFVGLLQGAGATRESLRINIVATLLFQIPLSYVLGFVFDLGALGVWMALPIAFAGKAFWGFFAYRAERWAQTGATV
jgi:putative MATE family efflux protein